MAEDAPKNDHADEISEEDLEQVAGGINNGLSGQLGEAGGVGEALR